LWIRSSWIRSSWVWNVCVWTATPLVDTVLVHPWIGTNHGYDMLHGYALQVIGIRYTLFR
jgi:hypothetical protein